ncbi:MAG: hypothetical protein EZS28_001994 [Streblomastix strix]|uniref:Uncharacterized protein n=1 Tax=Streblomastix strix TaxID=222440 RepID=A0A5J4X5J7_9EUKA|nr:MAG: hypothetical protein EZS28_001994 [Streblomastix strix]
MLLLKADKSELIDSYSKVEDDDLLALKINVADIIDSYSKIDDGALLLLKANVADIIDSYFKTEDDALLLLKANVADIVDSYSKKEDDVLLLLKADKIQLIDSHSKSETYTRDEVCTKSDDDALLLLKADKSELIVSYFKTETETLLDAQADKTFLANYVDLTSAQTISGQNNSEQQEVRDIATGKSKAQVFTTQKELNDLMAIQDNVAKLVIGDNLYIVDKELIDYW